MIDKQAVKTYFINLQNAICTAAISCEKTQVSDSVFLVDDWQREQGGGGQTRVLEGGAVFEKAGVNFSHITGDELPSAATIQRPELVGRSFEAMGVSVVMHPDSPLIPTAHMNVRCFVAEKQGEVPVWWFGGGFDLTPYYPYKEDVLHWHQTAFDACKPFDSVMGFNIYESFKQRCDEYFYIKHRNEARGVGGLFFDDLNLPDFESAFALTKNIGDAFNEAYMPIVKKRMLEGYSDKQKAFQRYRRGRYVEFNLVHDRGTLFGLQTGGRTESILMSLPPAVDWTYNWMPEKGSEESKIYDFLTPQNWL